MRFSCESCGAQYQIKPSKLGERGVKVRCKKCSFVIILRPPGYVPKKKSAGQPPTSEIEARATDDMPPSADLGSADLAGPSALGQADKEDAATQVSDRQALEDAPPRSDPPFPAASKEEAAELAHEFATSSDFGLSQEFKALGFEDDARAQSVPDPAKFEFDPHALKESAATASTPSPFDPETSGGSASEVAFGDESSEPETTVGPVPTSLVEQTRPDNNSEAATFGGEQDPVMPTFPQNGFVPPSGGVDPLNEGPKNEEDALAALEASLSGPTPVSAPEESPLESSDSDSAASAALEMNDGDINQAVAAFGSTEMDQMQAAVDDELASIQSELDKELEGISNDLDGRNGRAPDDAPTDDSMMAMGSSDLTDEEMDAARELANAHPGQVETEIGSAFQAMFEQGLSDEHRDPTAVFNADAMGQVEAEQDRARVDDPDAKEWYVAIDDAQVGPMSFADIQTHWNDKKVDPSSLCWKQGMGDWCPIAEVEALATLGSMEMPATVPSEDILGGMSPEISLPPERPGLAAAFGAGGGAGGGLGAVEDSSWRPSAANALASLAAEELSVSPSAAPEQNDIAVGPALPAPDALEKLLGNNGDKAISGSPFGALEKSESRVRPLPPRTDTVSTIPLRDPIDERRGSPPWMIPAAILIGCLILGSIVVAGMKFLKDDPQPGVAIASTAIPAVPPTTPDKPDPAPTWTETKAPPPAAEAAVEPPATADSAVDAKSGPDGEPAKAAAMVARDDPPPAKKLTPKKTTKRTKRTTRKSKRTRRPAGTAPPPPPRRRARAGPDDDLLPPAAPSRRRRVVDDDPGLQRELDDSDVLGVIRKHKREVVSCLKKHQRSSDSNVTGRMTVKMLIRKSGATTKVRVSPKKFASSVVGKCMVSSVKRWRFPRFSGPNMPIDFPVNVRGG